MPAEFKSYDDALLSAKANIRSNFPGATISDDSFFHLIASMVTKARMGASGYAKVLYNATRPDLATGDWLDELADKHGVTRKAASTAHGLEVTVTVTDAGLWPAGLALTTESGLAFVTSAAGSWTSGGTETLTIESTTEGTANNLPVGAELTITAPPANMESTATMASWSSDFARARDLETDAELQLRLADKIGGTATGGNAAAYVDWILSDEQDRRLLALSENIAQAAYIYPCARSILDVSAVPVLAWDGIQKRPAVAAFHTDIETYVASKVHGGVDFDSVAFTEDAQSIRLTLSTTAGYGRDWGTAATSSLITDATTHTTTRVYLTAAPSTENLEAGDRIMLHIGTNFFPNVRLVTAVDNSNDWVEVDTPFADESGEATAPAAAGGQDVRPAGPVSQAVVDNVLALFGTLTPSDTAAEIRWPPVDQAHPVDLTTAGISRAVLDADTDHIYDVTINTGTATCTTSAVAGGVLVAYILSPTRADDWCRVEFSALND